MSNVELRLNRGIAQMAQTGPAVAPWSETDETVLRAPFEYLSEVPGKDLRRQLILAFNVIFEVPETKLAVITRLIHTLHTASLLVDDVEDRAVLRRGQPVAHAVYGEPWTVNSANYMVFVALDMATTELGASASQIVTRELMNLHRGQGLDIYWRDKHVCPSMDDYYKMVNHKTGGLLRLAVELLRCEAPVATQSHADELLELSTTLGLLYQVQDDYLNLTSSQYTKNKGYAEDITEGKYSFPIIHSVNASTGGRLEEILQMRTSDDELKRQALQQIAATGSFEYTRKVVLELAGRAEHQIAGFSVGDTHKAVLLKMVRKLVMVEPAQADTDIDTEHVA